MENPILYVFLNKDLHMTVGKATAQGIHAAMMANAKLINDEDREKWSSAPHKTVIVLEARNEQHMKRVSEYLGERKIPNYYVIDEGVNEIDPHVITALATPILNKDDEHVIKTIGYQSNFALYKDVATFTVGFER